MNKTPLGILKSYWGHETFRSSQAEIIQSVLEKKDTLALLPTGGGKSICYQIPALLNEGICIVISPLIALIQDQVDSLRNKGIKVLSIYSGMSPREIDITLDNAIYGDYSFLYVSPERLQTDLFIERFRKMKVSFVAIDEAHCISQWGYDFRPAYLKIANLKKIKKNLQFIAVTATATPPVVKDIQNQLKFNSKTVFQSSFVRANLKYITLESKNKLDDTISIVKKLKGSGIIYCSTRKGTKELHQHLKNSGEITDFYHGGLDKETRHQKQTNWMQNKTRIIVCTNAFGMGIDKPDVRFIIHYYVPENIESYFQEAGRAGRDQKPARAILYYDNNDIDSIDEKIALKFPDISIIKNIYNALGSHLQLAIGSGKDEIFNLNLVDFSAKYNLNLYTTYNAIKILENSNLLKLNDYNYSQSRMKILVDKMDLYQYQVRSQKHDQIIQFVLRSHLGIFDEYLQISEAIIAKKLKTSVKDIIDSLEQLKKQQVIDYIPFKSGYQVIYLTERLSDNNFTIPKPFYESRKEAAILKANSINNFLQNNICRQTYIIKYFGLPAPKNCGHCSVCLNLNISKNNKTLSSNILDYLKKESKSNESVSISQLNNIFSHATKQEVQHAILWLSEHEKIKVDLSGRTILL
ncbi:MAG: ATP-dependent DNA helicase RecQ [Crocinitomicaceae bacterium]